jgi:lysyl-tRNA synthetase class 2
LIPYRFDRTRDAASLHAEFDAVEPGGETGVEVSVAGRVMLLRTQGKLAFGDLRDSSGSVQLFAGAQWTEGFDGFAGLSLGDWVGAIGEVVRTKRGELSVKVRRWELLAEARRGFGDKWHGVTDVDTRYRQRYVDLWVNEASRATFQLRSRLISLTRRWLEDRGFVEVEAVLKDGRHQAVRVDEAPGHPCRELTWDDIAAKFMDCAAQARIDLGKAERALDTLAHLETCTDVSEVVALLR